MREYDERKELIKVQCNVCSKNFKLEQGILKGGCFQADFAWGYFSSMDGENHSFDLCEDCYRKMIQKFAVPVHVEEVTELL